MAPFFAHASASFISVHSSIQNPPMCSFVSVYGPSVTSTLPSRWARSVFALAGGGNAAGELPHAGSNHFAIERVNLFHHRFGYGGRVKVVGDVVTNQILWHRSFSLVSAACFLWLVLDDPLSVHPGLIVLLSYSRWRDGKSTAILILFPAFYFLAGGPLILVSREPTTSNLYF